MVEALKALSTFFVDNSLRSRRNLRGDIEKRSLAINESFESAFREVKQSTRDQTSDLISKTTKLQGESQRIQMKETVADAFISRFQLKPDEAQALKGTRNGPISETFFEALGRVKEIHNDCKLLLRTKQQTAGLQIMEAMALHLESSYEKLYRWSQVKTGCKNWTHKSGRTKVDAQKWTHKSGRTKVDAPKWTHQSGRTKWTHKSGTHKSGCTKVDAQKWT
ncbi:Golgi transport complex subunit 6 [Desmophyllum pertusum]|uniref:Conserved oligomeric Golgi complex subunit 6 n=1 Tax=Desmophyllum pertusum TaxID=174260 RepID=A0A9W9ZNK3_9CNID|nr:Golgi transport complex subunit 6 [Desmophyllum pertusum]